MKYNELIDKALKARERAYCPYSDFAVGAALLCSDNSIYTGCNIENSSFTPSICAERVAIYNAISDGKRDFVAIAITGDNKDNNIPLDYSMPCGVCRQTLSEFVDKDFKIVVARSQNDYKDFTFEQLFPMSFKFKK